MAVEDGWAEPNAKMSVEFNPWTSLTPPRVQKRAFKIAYMEELVLKSVDVFATHLVINNTDSNQRDRFLVVNLFLLCNISKESQVPSTSMTKLPTAFMFNVSW